MSDPASPLSWNTAPPVLAKSRWTHPTDAPPLAAEARTISCVPDGRGEAARLRVLVMAPMQSRARAIVIYVCFILLLFKT